MLKIMVKGLNQNDPEKETQIIFYDPEIDYIDDTYKWAFEYSRLGNMPYLRDIVINQHPNLKSLFE